MELYLSVDDVLDPDTDRMLSTLKDRNGVVYDGFRGGLDRGEMAVLPTLIGNYFIIIDINDEIIGCLNNRDLAVLRTPISNFHVLRY